jgi:L-lysine exporter family protein LysE/ArgO
MVFAFGKGLLFGIGMSLMLGTVFFSLIQNSIQNGWNKGVLIALGVAASDIIFISLAVIGVSFISPESNNYWLQSAAAGLLLFLGFNLLFNRQPKIVFPQTRLGKAVYYFSNGFLLNVLNPVNFLFWAGLATIARSDWAYSTGKLIVFFSGCVISIFLSEVLISFLAHRIKPYLKPGMLKWINRVTGILFLGIAGKLIWDVFFR